MIEKKHSKTILGLQAEEKASQFLQTKGLHCLARNFRCAYGEIDLIMQDGEEVVFVEVRSRNRTDFGYAEESIDYKKQKKLLNAATYFLQQKDWLDSVDCRFDFIGVSNNKIKWIKDAFFYE